MAWDVYFVIKLRQKTGEREEKRRKSKRKRRKTRRRGRVSGEEGERGMILYQ
jgi:hypothetical protein